MTKPKKAIVTDNIYKCGFTIILMKKEMKKEGKLFVFLALGFILFALFLINGVMALTQLKTCYSTADNGQCSISFNNLGGVTSATLSARGNGDLGGGQAPDLERIEVLVDGVYAGVMTDGTGMTGPNCNYRGVMMPNNINVLSYAGDGVINVLCDAKGAAVVNYIGACGYSFICDVTLTYTPCAVTNGGVEICDGIDNDCDGQIDEGLCICGNGILETKTGYTEQCDDRNALNSDSCKNDCTNNIMGDGYVLVGVEECDDGNLIDGDGCNSAGSIESGWTCIVNASGTSICCFNACISESTERECIDINTRKTRTCVQNATSGCYIWESWSSGVSCSSESVCVSGQCFNLKGQPVRFCSDYEAESECNDDEFGVCEDSVNEILFNESGYTEMPDEGFCGTDIPLNPVPEDVPPYGKCSYYVENCSCVWDSGESSCAISYEQSRECDNPAGNGKGSCRLVTTEVENNCATTGYITYTRKAEWVSFEGIALAMAGTCNDYVKTYKCVKTAKLPFFTWISFAASIGLIAGIYIFKIIKNKKCKNEQS